MKRFIRGDYVSVYKWDLDGRASFLQKEPFLLASVIEGEGKFVVDDENFYWKKGDHFIIPATISQFILEGKAELVISHP
jgi:mannose-6-phosphate isomerase